MSEEWNALRALTTARIGLDKAGGSLTTREMLQFRQDHALARDSVWSELNTFDLEHQLNERSLKFLRLRSKAKNREIFISRPDLGRQLDDWSITQLQKHPSDSFDISIVITEGLSAPAIEHHAIPFLREFLRESNNDYSFAPICIVQRGRVAIGDEVGHLLKAKIVIVMIGERPGLSSPDSMGAYMTFGPKKGTTDERRNCISNIRHAGLSYPFAAQKLMFLVKESITKKISGVNLKDNFNQNLSDNAGK